jgi:Glycosyltransferase family 87
VSSSRRGTWTATAAGAVLLAISFYALVAWLERGRLSGDVGGYHGFAIQMRAGEVPYRDFSFEYPPAALPPMLLSAYLPWSYATSFAVLMGVCGAGCLVAAASALSAVGATADRVWLSLLLIGGSPLVLGSLFDTRFDLWPTLLAIGALAALLHERPLATGALVGLGFAAKLWPGGLLLLALGLTQTWFPSHYWPLASNLAAPWSWFLLARDLSLVALAGVLVVGLSRARDSAEGRAGWPAARRAGA